ncbi:IS1096 element passenger TnpR family protein [Candidatus Electrothrix sp.]|uniref:IS1096 element passenger TnpR family protein n=1 Tax=Candidatus Electrothrix sp. TaxID=2170559 RepID=UPI004057AA72
MKLKRNDKCPCGSGKKYKKCCYLDEEKNAEILRLTSQTNNFDKLAELLSRPMQIYRLKVILKRMGFEEIGEEVSRTFEIGGRYNLYDLHLEIQRAFAWDNDHMFSFYFGGELFDRPNEYSGSPLGEHFASRIGPSSKSAAKTQLRDLGLKKEQGFLYLFDYGDELVHEILVEGIRDKEEDEKGVPVVVKKVGEPPAQYDDSEYEDWEEDDEY